MQNYNDNKKDVVIITCFAANEPRAEYVRDFFEKRGKSTLVISTDFIHRGKFFRKDLPAGYTFVHTRYYKKNLSIARLRSHYVFSKTAMELAKKHQPELLYVMIPANSLAKFAVRYKKINNCKLVLDIIDLWPESLPVPIGKNIWPLSVWRGLRDKNLGLADVIITECDLYQKSLQLKVLDIPTHTVYWPQEDYGDVVSLSREDSVLKFLYLGSINNIIDIEGIVELLVKVQKLREIELHIVGDGETRNRFLDLLKEYRVPVIFHGYIYDHDKLKEIASQCHWGINMMKPSAQVGLTMKSVSYFELGLPIINNIRSDTWKFIENYEVGVNAVDIVPEKIAYLTRAELDNMRVNARKLFEQYFSKSAFEGQLKEAICNVWGEL